MRYIIPISLSWLVVIPSFGQTYDLNPRSWFPLEVGSIWHYRYHDDFFGEINLIRKATKDSTVGGNSWTVIEDVLCIPSFIPPCQGRGRRESYRFTDGDYLLSSTAKTIGANPDTLLPTFPSSFFRTNTESDTLQSPYSTVPVIVEITTNDIGSISDSTHLTLGVVGNIFFGGVFIYRIGNGAGLVGATIDDITYGDTTFISSYVLGNEEQILPNISPGLNPYPNPTSSSVSIPFTSFPIRHIHSSDCQRSWARGLAINTTRCQRYFVAFLLAWG